jgi:hypothetical protein
MKRRCAGNGTVMGFFFKISRETSWVTYRWRRLQALSIGRLITITASNGVNFEIDKGRVFHHCAGQRAGANPPSEYAGRKWIPATREK